MTENVEMCTHWNDRLPGGIPLRPVRCELPAAHRGRHQLGDTSWSTDLGVWSPALDPKETE